MNDEFGQLYELEKSLWIKNTRFDKDYMNEILDEDFFEFGRSGLIYSRVECISAPSEEIRIYFPLKNFTVSSLTDTIFLVTYISEVEYEGKEISNRSSIWIKTSNGRKLRFHQGTPMKKGIAAY